MNAIRPLYRSYELAWSVPEDERERLRKVVIATLIVAVVLCILFPLLPSPKRAQNAVEEVPPRLAKLMIEQQKPPPPPPPPPKEEPKPVKTEPKPVPKPVDRQQQARARAAAALMPLDELADLRDNTNVDLASSKRPLTDATRAGDLSERSLITSKVGQGSGGINTSNMSRGFGGGGGGNLTGRSTTQVTSGIAGDARGASRTGGGGKAARSREEIELVFDRNKGAIYALYNRALRSTPTLQGKVVLELTIAPSGEVTNCRIVSSELKDEDLERKLVARVKMFRFEEKDVETITTTKPIDFFPRLTTMNLQSEIEFFCDLFPIDKAGFLALLMYELAEEAKTTYGPATDQVINPGMLRFINELQQRISRFAYQILSEDTTRPADDVVIRMLLTPRPDKAAERVIVNSYRRTLQGFDRHSSSSVLLG